MHQHCLVMTDVMRLGGLMSPMFCLSLLVRRRRVQNLLRRQLRVYLKSGGIKVIHEPPTEEQRSFVAAILDLLEELLTVRLETETATSRIVAWRRLRAILHGIGVNGLLHYCPVGCHCKMQAKY